MAEDSGQEHNDQQSDRGSEREVAQSGMGQGELWVTSSAPVSTGTLMAGDPRLNRRGNAPVRAAVMQRMQHTYGNRAVRRFLQRMKDETTATASSTDTELAHSIHTAQLIPAPSSLAFVQREDKDKEKEKEKEEDNKRFEEIKKVCEAIPTGQEALKVMDKYTVKVAFTPGGGAQYNQSTNTMEIGRTVPTARAALAFVHEINHAKYKNEGLSADVNKLTREEYVKKMIEEEAEGVVKSIEAKIELEGTKIDVSKTSYPLEKEYREAYKAAVDSAKSKDPKKSEEKLKALGRTAGKKRVTQGFMKGEVVGSKSGKNYVEKYGEFWDSQHKQGQKRKLDAKDNRENQRAKK